MKGQPQLEKNKQTNKIQEKSSLHWQVRYDKAETDIAIPFTVDLGLNQGCSILI